MMFHRLIPVCPPVQALSSSFYSPPHKKKTDQTVCLLYGVGNGTRTHNAWNHNPVLCQLNYTHHIRMNNE